MSRLENFLRSAIVLPTILLTTPIDAQIVSDGEIVLPGDHDYRMDIKTIRVRRGTTAILSVNKQSFFAQDHEAFSIPKYDLAYPPHGIVGPIDGPDQRIDKQTPVAYLNDEVTARYVPD